MHVKQIAPLTLTGQCFKRPCHSIHPSGHSVHQIYNSITASILCAGRFSIRGCAAEFWNSAAVDCQRDCSRVAMSRLKASATVQLDTNRQYGCLAGFRTHDTARERDDSSQQLSAVAQSVLPVFLSFNLDASCRKFRDIPMERRAPPPPPSYGQQHNTFSAPPVISPHVPRDTELLSPQNPYGDGASPSGGITGPPGYGGAAYADGHPM